MSPIPDAELTTHLKSLYHQYRHTPSITTRCEQFLSPRCSQVCRSIPAFAADHDRDTIARYLREAAASGASMFPSDDTGEKRLFYSIRPITETEIEFGNEDVLRHAGFVDAAEVKGLVESEGWVGMRVDLWDDGTDEEVVLHKGTLVKVRYWWRQEGEKGWVQVLHDILWIGERDGSEGEGGEALE